MKEFKTTVTDAKIIAEDIIRLRLAKPKGYVIEPGHSITLRFNDPEWLEQKKPLTPTSLPENEYIEVMCKRYPEKSGLSVRMYDFKGGEEVFITEPYGKYEFRGPGTFVSMGIGVTPFIALIREAHKEGKLGDSKFLISNRTCDSFVILDELKEMLGDNLHLFTTKEKDESCHYGRINEEALKEIGVNVDQQVYICGSGPFKMAMKELFEKIGATKILF